MTANKDALLLAKIIDAMPAEWRGTTFRNSHLLGREGFSTNLTDLITRKKSSDPISTSELVELGNAEDYLRVATNVSTTVEAFLARAMDCSVSQIFTFASKAMPIVAVLLTAKKQA